MECWCDKMAVIAMINACRSVPGHTTMHAPIVVFAMLAYLALRNPGDGPLFHFALGKAMTRQHLSWWLSEKSRQLRASF